MIVNLNDSSNIPSLAEPWFLSFNADVEFRVVMTPGDLKKAGLDELGQLSDRWVRAVPSSCSGFVID